MPVFIGPGPAPTGRPGMTRKAVLESPVAAPCIPWPLSPVYSSNISRRVERVALSLSRPTVPSRRISRRLSRARICSSRMRPDLPWKRTGMREGAGRFPVVIGAAMTVGKWSFISGGDTIRQGRVFWVSLPMVVGSSAASHTSPHVMPRPPRRFCLTTATRRHPRSRTEAKRDPRLRVPRSRRMPPPSPHAVVF